NICDGGVILIVQSARMIAASASPWTFPKSARDLNGGSERMAVPFKTILCPIDFDENSVLALDKAAELARQFGSGLIVLHVLPLVLSFGGVPPPAAMFEDQEKAARAKLGDIAKKKLAGLTYELHVYTGDVIGGILSAQGK